MPFEPAATGNRLIRVNCPSRRPSTTLASVRAAFSTRLSAVSPAFPAVGPRVVRERPVPGEKKVDNNSQRFPAIFTR